MTKKVADKRLGRPTRGGAEYRFTIDAYSPRTIPMARLAEYMRELAEIFGEPAAVHFKRLAAGSTVLVSTVQREAVPKVRHRILCVRRQEGSTEALRAYRAINKLLREDNGVGVLRDAQSKGATIIRFPGREEAKESFPSVREHGSLDGTIVRIGGTDETVHITLEIEGEQVAGCYTSRMIGKQLGHKLFDPVRLFGRGRWSRDDDGQWALQSFKVESFEPLSDAPLSQALTAVRAVDSEWTKGTVAELDIVRHGPPKKSNGRR